ncbi:GAF domain-containing sensor histidine kinase [Chloroflexus sp.]|uniref:GAF domain-containing sensor histidine kinase n=1 Tax=Chloroflexus sp. TaxID=1904827 RepID=UPI00298F3C7A|nr:GAF domain-containing sensor histidine kinase [Chloroflexus sp.]MDW8403330.1 GAF domain-containing sensor histidine kinase [Chloroflexus sp.]
MAPTTDQTADEIERLVEIAEHLRAGDFAIEVPMPSSEDQRLRRLAASLRELAASLARRQREIETLHRITTRINAGLMLDEILDGVYNDFRDVIPYERIGFALLEDGGNVLRARWARTSLPAVHLKRGYAAPMAGSSLETILQTGQPRIINDLVQYLRRKPESESTRLIVNEGIRSSLTCPLIANGVPVGFIFFSSAKTNTYTNEHVERYMQIAEQLSVIVEKGNLVSQLAAQKELLEQQNAELRRLSALKNNLLGMVAHDLRNPVAIIQMMAAILRNQQLQRPPEERQRMLDDIYRQTEHMLAMLNDLLDLSQIESGTVTISPEPVAIKPLLEETINRHQLLANPKQTHIELAAPVEGTVYADPLRLRQVLDNLISNAVKFSPPGSTITVRATRDGDWWKFAVTDQGPGISPDERSQLFEAFSRLSARPTGGEKSTGLGLAIARKVVMAHGGVIDVSSTPGQGATFWFTLPVAPREEV